MYNTFTEPIWVFLPVMASGSAYTWKLNYTSGTVKVNINVTQKNAPQYHTKLVE